MRAYKWLPSSSNPFKYSPARDYLSKDMADPSPERETIARFIPITHCLANAIQYYIKSYSNLVCALQWLPSSGYLCKHPPAWDYQAKDMADPSSERDIIARYLPIPDCLARMWGTLRYYIKLYSSLV